MPKTNYIQLYGLGGDFTSLFSGMFGGFKPQQGELENSNLQDRGPQIDLSTLKSAGVSGGGMTNNLTLAQHINPASSAMDLPSIASKPTTFGGMDASQWGSIGSAALGELGTIQNASKLPSQSLKTEAIADGTVNAVGSALSALGPWGAVAGTALKLVNGVGGSLMNGNSTAKAADAFKINQDVAQSSGYGGVTSGAQATMGDGQGYKKAGLFGKLFTNTGNLKDEFTRSNSQQFAASNILNANKMAQEQSASSAGMFSDRTQQKNYNSSAWNNGAITFGKKGMKIGKGGIHIKKSHEGKFTEFKKRTGETTAEAKQSSDPHVRKMATFAANAAKWKHQEGGTLAKPIKSPAGGSAKYLEGYNTAFDNNLTSKTLGQDLGAIRQYQSDGRFTWDNNTSDFYKGQSDALQDLMNQMPKPKHVYPAVTLAANPTMQRSSIPNHQSGGSLAVSGSTPTKTAEDMYKKLGKAATTVNLKRMKNIKKKQQGGVMQQDHTAYKHDIKDEPNNGYTKWLESLPQRLRGTSDYDLKGYFDKYGATNVVGDQHLTDEFKKPNHVTFSSESIYNSPDHQGGEWRKGADSQWEFVASPWNIKNVGVDSLQTYFKQNEPSARLILPPTIRKSGGPINVIADGAFHSRKHALKQNPELADAKITTKGIPVVSGLEDGDIVQHAEVEKDELILHYDLTKQLEGLHKEGTDESAIQAGRILSKEIVKNTKDSSSKLIKNG